MKKHTLLLACAMRILLNLIALPMRGRLFDFSPSRPSRAVDNSLCEMIFARKEEE